MAKKRFIPEQIVTPRQIEVTMGQGKSAQLACREAGISEQNFYRCCKEYGGLDLDQARRMRPERRNRVWSYDFVEAQTHDGCKVRLMTLIDEFTRECLVIRMARRTNSLGVLETMADVMLVRGIPEHIRSDNGPEMTAKIVRQWLGGLAPRPCTSSLEVPGVYSHIVFILSN